MSLSLEVALSLTPMAHREEGDPPSKPVCSRCQSSEVTFDATAYWNFRDQQFEYDILFDEVYCPNCDGKQRVEWVPL